MDQSQNQVLTGKPNIRSIELLEELLQYRATDITYLALHAADYYSRFLHKEKPRPFSRKNNFEKVRLIEKPSGPLKEIQKRIYEHILAQISLPDFICGGVKEKSTTKNALIHQQSRVLVTIDIKNYFPSITSRQIFYVWGEILGCSPAISDILTKLTTYKGHLPQGAPTSTCLANIFLYSIDNPIRAECERLGISYSVWVDDTAFSGYDARRIIPVVIATLRKAGLKISRRKLKVMGAGKGKLITGIVLGSKLSVPASYTNGLRAGIHKLLTSQIPPEELPYYLRQLEGSIEYVRSINRNKGEKLRRDLEIAKKAL